MNKANQIEMLNKTIEESKFFLRRANRYTAHMYKLLALWDKTPFWKFWVLRRINTTLNNLEHKIYYYIYKSETEYYQARLILENIKDAS